MSDRLGSSALSQATPQLFDEGPFEGGFSWRILIGAVFVGLVMLPGAIYMGLISGQSLAGAAEWVTIILFIEIGKRSFIRLRRQEIILLYWVAAGLLAAGAAFGSGAILFGGPFGSKIWDQYLIQSPQAEGLGIAEKIPSWFVPNDPDVLRQRSFFHQDWVIPILLLVVHASLTYALTLAGGYLLYRITNDIERLRFPLAPVNAAGATALAESSAKSETWRWRVFSIGAMIGIGFGAIHKGVPIVTGIFAKQPIMILPIPWIDFTAEIGQVLPAACLGIDPNLALLLVGFVLPWRVVAGIFLGSISVYLIANPVLYHYGILHDWEAGLEVRYTAVLNHLNFWLSASIGVALFVALVGILSVVRRLTRGPERRDLAEHQRYLDSIRGRGSFPMSLAAAITIVITLAYVGICHYLVPDFNVWILLLFGFVFSPLISYVSARMIGITGSATGASFPYLREGTFILSGYKGVAIWFAPLPLFNLGKAAETFKQLELTRTRFASVVKSQAVALVVMLLCSFLFWSLIWGLAPIPSSAYPFVQKMWPYNAQWQCIWVSSTLASDRVTCEELDRDFEANPLEEDPAKRWSDEVSRVMGRLVDLRPHATKHRPRPDDQNPIVVVELRRAAAMTRLKPDASTGSALAGQLGRAGAILWVIAGGEVTAREEVVLSEIANSAPNRARMFWIAERGADELTKLTSGRANVEIGPRRNFLLEAIRPSYIVAGCILAGVLYVLVAAVGVGSALFYGLIGGIAVWPHFAILQFVGAVLGRRYLARRFGADRWRAWTPVLLAGYACGDGLVAMLGIGVALLMKAITKVII